MNYTGAHLVLLLEAQSSQKFAMVWYGNIVAALASVDVVFTPYMAYYTSNTSPFKVIGKKRIYGSLKIGKKWILEQFSRAA